MTPAVIPGAAGAVAAVAGLVWWVKSRRLRYKRHSIVEFDDVRARMRTGDIILFHKTSRNGLVDALELDVVSPLLFSENEFRHSGIILRRGGELFVLECADRFHSGHGEASYLTAGNGIRMVPLETLLAAYNRDNGDPHFGIRHIAEEIGEDVMMAALAEYGPVDYLKMHRSAYVFVSCAVLPKARQAGVLDRYPNEMMCSEFVHSLLNRCGVLRDYPSKLFAPYTIENSKAFGELELVKYSEIERFRYSG